MTSIWQMAESSHVQRTSVPVPLLLLTVSCARLPSAPAPYPSTLDIALVHDEVTVLINSVRASPLAWDEDLQGLAERRAWKIVKGEIPFDEVDDSLANELGGPVAELRACPSADVTTPAAVAEAAVEQWLVEPELREMLLGDWERIGVGFDWGCPKPDARGVVLVVVMGGRAYWKSA